jgi:hypothetical protein
LLSSRGLIHDLLHAFFIFFESLLQLLQLVLLGKSPLEHVEVVSNQFLFLFASGVGASCVLGFLLLLLFPDFARLLLRDALNGGADYVVSRLDPVYVLLICCLN